VNSLRQLFAHLSWSQRIGLFTAVAAVIGGLVALQHWNQERVFKPLFSGLATEDAGAVTSKLRESATDYRLSDDGSTVLVASDRVAEVRLQLASAGLPRSGRIGFELFDKTNFGASEFAEQVNYHRAIEGELERSVMSLREVEQARVHITLAKDSLYTESREPAKASILVKLRQIGGLSPQNVAALCQLVASAVPGLRPDQVSVLDTSGNLLNRPGPIGSGDGAEAGEAAALEYRKSVEHDIQTKATQTLDPLLGAGHFRVGVSADVDLTSGEQSEETFDPAKSVMLTSQTTEDGPALAAAAGVPGTASNLPRPTAKAESSGASTTNYSRRTENVSYQTSRVVRHTRLPEGVVKRVSLSVLIDHSLRWDQGKRIIEPPSEEKLKVIHDLVAAAAGIDMNRGDQLVVEAFPFEATLTAEPVTLDQPAVAPAPAGPPLPKWLANLLGRKNGLAMAGGVVVAIVVVIVGLVVLLRRRGGKKVQLTKAIQGGSSRELASPTLDAEKSIEARMAEHAAEHGRKEAEAILALKIPDVSTKKTEVLTKHIAAEAKKDPTSMAHVVRSWLHGEYQR